MDKTTNFKVECREAFQYSPYLGQIMEALEKNQPNTARVFMVDAIYDLQNTINQKIGQDEAAIHNGRIESFQRMNRCVDTLMYVMEDTSLISKIYELLR